MWDSNICQSQNICKQKKYLLVPNKKKHKSNSKWTMNIFTWCLGLTVYSIKCLLKARKSIKTIASIMQENFLSTILLKLALEKCRSLLKKNGFNWLCTEGPRHDYRDTDQDDSLSCLDSSCCARYKFADGIDGKCEYYAAVTIVIVLMLLVAPDLDCW